MDFGTLIGVIGGAFLVLLAILLKADLVNFIDPASILIVFGGTTAATLSAFPLPSTLLAFRTSIKVFFSHRIDFSAVLKELILLAALARKKGLVAMEQHKTEDAYLKKAISLTADGTESRIIKEILELERDAIEERHIESQLILEKMGDLAPAWGMIGTLIGLVIMLLNLNDPSTIGPAMAIALLTTFYGAFWANYFLLPAANKLEQRTKKELLRSSLIIETMIAISKNEHPRILQERLLSFLPSRERAKAVPTVKKAKTAKKAA
jgi:chemotaxis protein MotA